MCGDARWRAHLSARCALFQQALREPHVGGIDILLAGYGHGRWLAVRPLNEPNRSRRFEDRLQVFGGAVQVRLQTDADTGVPFAYALEQLDSTIDVWAVFHIDPDEPTCAFRLGCDVSEFACAHFFVDIEPELRGSYRDVHGHAVTRACLQHVDVMTTHILSLGSIGNVFTEPREHVEKPMRA